MATPLTMNIETSLTELEALGEQFPEAESDRLYDLARQRAIKAEQSLLELAALAADLSIDDITNLGLEPGVGLLNVPNLLATYEPDSERDTKEFLEILRSMNDTPDALEMAPLILAAVVRRYPDDPLGFLQRIKDEDWDPDDIPLDDVFGQIRGHYFEELVVSQLKSGQVLGELWLQAGQTVDLPLDPTIRGWDIQIFDGDTLNERFSLKATESIKRVKEALQEYPRFRVVATSEIDGTAEDILTTDISNSELQEDMKGWVREINEAEDGAFSIDISDPNLKERILRQAEESVEGSLDNALDNAVEIALDAVPVVSGVIVLVSEGRAVLMGAAQLEDALKRGAQRLGKATAFTTAGAIMTAASVPGIAVTPALLAARVWASRLGNRATMGTIAKEHADTLLALRQQPLQ